MSESSSWPGVTRHRRPFCVSRLRRLVFATIVLLPCTSLLVALETPSKPFLERNSFLLSSAGFRVKIANDPAGQKALRALPAHRFVIHRDGGVAHYVYAEPVRCVCIFIGTE